MFQNPFKFAVESFTFGRRIEKTFKEFYVYSSVMSLLETSTFLFSSQIKRTNVKDCASFHLRSNETHIVIVPHVFTANGWFVCSLSFASMCRLKKLLLEAVCLLNMGLSFS